MKAFAYDGGAGGGSLGMAWTSVHPAPKPQLKAGHVLVEIRAAGINPVDYKLPQLMPSFILGRRAAGLDFSGVVCDSASSKFPVGSKIFGLADGTLAEKISASEEAIALKPDSLSFLEAASLPTVALTGYQGLLLGGATAGSSVLVIGASGGCGSVGTQIAKAVVGDEGKVGGICGTANLEKALALGCDVVADYKNPAVLLGPDSPLRALAPFNCIYDTVTSPEAGDGLAGTTYDAALREAGLVGPETKISAINGSGLRWLRMFLGWQETNFKLFFTQRRADHLQQIAQWVEQGKLVPVLDSAAPFAFTPEGCVAAFERLKSRRAVGKIVVDVNRGQEK